MTKAYETGLERNPANYVPLTPISFLVRAAAIHPDRIAVIAGDRRIRYRDFYARSRRLASALSRRGVKRGETVAIMAANIPAMLEAHYGVPMMGAVLNTLNVRLDAPALAFILDHGEAKVLLCDRAFSSVIKEALAIAEAKPLVIDIDDPEVTGGEFLGKIEYEDLLKEGDENFAWLLPEDEWQAISLNYTSGTTGNPKGVVYHHRGAYLNAVSNVLSWHMGEAPVYLWTLPMFHCNGWCFPWTLSVIAGTHVCLRRVEAATIYKAIADHGVTHFCGAPVVMGMVINAKPGERRSFSHKVKMMTAAAPPPAAVLKAMQEQGFEVTHVYGLTETYGPDALCAWKSEWDALSIEEQSKLKARQGVNAPALEGLMVADPRTMQPVPDDGETMGEIMHRGNIVMKGYLKNPKATQEAFAGGWFHSGDLAVMHPDGYIEVKDRAKDIIISGGENISTIEVEGIIYRHPAVLEVAVVAKPDEKWGETPCAFVTLREGAQASEKEIIDFCRSNLAHFKAPKSVVFCSLPKTSTGKVQKFILRDRAKVVG